MPLLIHAVPGAFRVHRQTVELSGQSDGKVTDIDHLLDFSHTFRPNLAHLQADQFAQRFFDLTQGVSHVADNKTSLRGRNLAPVEKALMGRRRHLSVAILSQLGDGRQGLTRGRVAGNDPGAPIVTDPGTGSTASTGIGGINSKFLKKRPGVTGTSR